MFTYHTRLPTGPQQASFDDKENVTTSRSLKAMGSAGGSGAVKAGPISLKSTEQQSSRVARAFGADLTNKQLGGGSSGGGAGNGGGGAGFKKQQVRRGPRVRLAAKKSKKSSSKPLLLPDVESSHHSSYEEEVPRILDDDTVRRLCAPQLAPRRTNKSKSRRTASKKSTYASMPSLAEYEDVDFSSYDFELSNTDYTDLLSNDDLVGPLLHP
eukprot:CAMPEP_0177660500 /NCGR_PEP_ID=MMETSP0447-20121125/18078_1 /TAXON_ID=0 /ORGANISM="Stygamoeba regulata, Strain BSH-02190019" /LENGTH=211 /DNA_ID=CAMNT_0019165579 /DNA_START=176 /DNA_END=811 /DNA_ORIENTATION=+